MAGAIRLMGFGLNSRPTPLKRTNAGFFQMSVPTIPRVENRFMARKSTVILATDEAIACKRFHSHWANLCLGGELVNHGRLMAPVRFWGILFPIKNIPAYTPPSFT